MEGTLGSVELSVHVAMRFLCWLLGHSWFVVKRFSPTTRKVGCRQCGRLWGMNDSVRVLIDWDTELAELHGETE